MDLIYVILCNSGFIGILVWGIFLVKLFKNTAKISNNKEIVIFAITLTTYYLAYSVITGEYGYMKYLILFYTFILLEDKSVGKKR